MTYPETKTEAKIHQTDGEIPEEKIDDALLSTAYRLLVEHPGLDPSQFSTQLECDEELAGKILDRLTELALLRTDWNGGCGEIFVTVSPLAAMYRLIEQEGRLLYRRQQVLKQSTHTFAAILSAYGAYPDDLRGERIAEHLDDLPAVWRRMQELTISAKERMLAFSPRGTMPGATPTSRNIDLAPLDRGIQTRVMFQETIAMEPDRLAYAGELARAGADVRLVPELPMPMVIVDSSAVVVPRDPDHKSAAALVIHQEVILAALLALFETYWDRGRPLLCTSTGAGDFSVAERAVVRLLATGAKDDAVARQLGTSVRTVRRTVSALMSRAGVSSRLAFGAYAAAQGLI